MADHPNCGKFYYARQTMKLPDFKVVITKKTWFGAMVSITEVSTGRAWSGDFRRGLSKFIVEFTGGQNPMQLQLAADKNSIFFVAVFNYPACGSGWVPPPATPGGGSHVIPGSMPRILPNPPCLHKPSECVKIPSQCKYPIPNCKTKWVPGTVPGCHPYKWSAVKDVKDADLVDTVDGNTSDVGPDGPSWNPPLVGSDGQSWNPPLAKNLPEVIAKKIDCDCEIIPDYDPVYAKANLYPGVGIGYQRSKVVIVYTDEMYKNQPDLDDCPKREIEYHLHVNRLTERIRINRRTK